MSEKHTATPWRVGNYCGSVVADEVVPEIGGANDVAYYGGNLIAESIAPRNAAFIVRACNAHDALVSAAEHNQLHCRIALRLVRDELVCIYGAGRSREQAEMLMQIEQALAILDETEKERAALLLGAA